MDHRVRNEGSEKWRLGRIALVATVAAALAVPAALAAGYRSAPPEPGVGGLTPEQIAGNMLALHGRLVAELPAGALDNAVHLDLDDAERRELVERQGQDGGPAVVGRTKRAGVSIQIPAVDSRTVQIGNRPVGPGVLAPAADGGFVWAGAIVSDGAAALRLHFTGLNLPPRAELYVFSLTGEAFGPYWERGPHGDGDLWAPTIGGAETVVMLRQRGPASAAEMSRMKLDIAEIGHITPEFRGVSTESFCSYNVPCIENAECHNVSQAHQDAIALLQWISGAFITTCTGGLIADTDTSTQTPYVLTANHCISRAKDAKNVESFFFYTRPCGGSCPAQAVPGSSQYGTRTATLGTSIMATGTGGDYSLLRLNGPPPSGVSYLGWTTAPVANSNGTALERVSHPAWAPQSYSEHHVDTSRPTCQGFSRGPFIYSSDDLGGTEGGSSGSPVVNAAGEVVGQLFGACGTNVGNACDDVNNATVDGAFAYYFPNVEAFLDPSGGCTPTQTPETSCSDGIDNDCDGLVDGADPDCGGGSCVNPGGAPAGATCTDNAQCCSNNCKGRPGSKTCK